MGLCDCRSQHAASASRRGRLDLHTTVSYNDIDIVPPHVLVVTRSQVIAIDQQ